MTHAEKITEMLEKELVADVIPFLKSLTDKERKEIVPHIKKQQRYYSEIVNIGDNSYRSRGTANQFLILFYLCFACYELKEFTQIHLSWSVADLDKLNPILEWFVPTWFGDYVNSFVNEEFSPFNYNTIMYFAERGLMKPLPELIAKTLPAIVYTPAEEKHKHKFDIHKLEEKSIILDEQIWYLFDYECGINWSDRWIRLNSKPQDIEANWTGVFKYYTANGRIDRMRVLKELLAATNKNFTKTLCGWFIDLFIALEPTKEELQSLQTEMMAVLNGPQSKPVNTILNYFKKMAAEPTFAVDAFIEQAPLLLSVDVKSIHQSTLAILETLAKKYTDKREAICLAATQAFMSKDSTVQDKAARLIKQYTNEGSAVVSEALQPFTSSLQAAVKKELSAFLQTNEEQASPVSELSENTTEHFTPITEETKIEPVQNIEAFIFLLSQAMDNNKHYHIDQLASACIEYYEQVTAEHFTQMEPAFQRACKMLLNPTSAAGSLDVLLALFIIEFGLLLQQRFGNASTAFAKLHKKSVDEDVKRNNASTYYKLQIVPLSNWKSASNSNAYLPYKELLAYALEKIKDGNNLPLVSMPTHNGGWIAAEIFVERIINYEKAGMRPGNMDMQIAMFRTWLGDTTKAIALVNKLQNDELKQLLTFFLNKEAQPQAPFEKKAWWMIAGIVKTPDIVYEAFKDFSYATYNHLYFTGQFTWRTSDEKYLGYGKYDTDKKEYERVENTHCVLRIEFPESKGVRIKRSDIGRDEAKTEEINKDFLLPQYFNFNSTWANDMQRNISLMPNNPDVIIATVIKSCLSSSALYEVTEQNTIGQTIGALHELKNDLGEMSHLFLATTLLNPDKTIRAYAAGIWIERVSQNAINSCKTGEIIGHHESVEWAPLKRFTDTVATHMKDVSDKHNKALENLLASCIAMLPAKPIKDLKKLLELYYEVLVTNQSKPSDEKITGLLKEWKATATLKKVVSAFEKL